MFLHRFDITAQKKIKDLIGSVKHITRYVRPLSHDDRVTEALLRFQTEQKTQCLPVLNRSTLAGMLNRHRFMENHMVGKHGFGLSLNYYKKIDSILEDNFLQVDEHMTIEKVAKLVHRRKHHQLYDDICVTSKGFYLGIVSVSDVLNAIMENNLVLAIGANPLSGLPGNDFIQRKIREQLQQKAAFDICYIDIDFFKPYNDKYGFVMGDRVIKLVSELMVEELEMLAGNANCFAGHIGGDDFILITEPEHSVDICRRIIVKFEKDRVHFHDTDEYSNGRYQSVNRKGEVEEFPLLSLSIAIVTSERSSSQSYAEISSVATEVKKKAKESRGSVIIRDQRQY